MSQDVRLTEEQSTQRRAGLLGFAYLDTSTVTNKNLYKELLGNQELYQMRVVPIMADAHNITFGVTTTTSQQSMDKLRKLFSDQRVNFVLISDTGFRDYMKLYDPPRKVEYKNIDLAGAGHEDLIRQVTGTLEQIRADDMLAYLVQQAHRLNASDIHVENETDHTRIRLRIDGVLHPIARISREKTHVLISAIASAANVSTASAEAQQGHIAQRVKMADGTLVDVNLRVETVSAIDGMDVVMRLFNMSQELFVLEKLGLSDQEMAVVQDIVNRPNGLVLAVGPTGSGKTTTLYSILNSLNSEERKIITIEDPVEYQFKGITQISVASKTAQEKSFANSLRAVLRLDPDVVMVGEIRDSDTAKTALQAALTGHLVLSTFHAGSASAAITRLMDVIDENPLFISAIRLVMAQRLVRRLDDTTKQEYEPDAATKQNLQSIIETLPPNVPRPDISSIRLYKAGASAENPYGYRGQLAIREQFLMTPELRSLLQSQTKITTQDIETEAIRNGMTTMLQDGILKVIAGQTTLEEIYRVVG